MVANSVAKYITFSDRTIFVANYRIKNGTIIWRLKQYYFGCYFGG